jgi:hypothetical protein
MRPPIISAGLHHSSNRIIYTVSTGDYVRYAPVYYTPPDGWDYALLTDADCPAYLSPKQQAAWAKINGLRIFTRHEIVLFVDDDITIEQDPAEVFKDATCVVHWRPGIPTLRANMDKTCRLRKAATSMQADAELRRYEAMGITDCKNYLCNMVYRTRCDDALRLSDEWWYWYSQSETQRDQPAFSVACTRLEMEPAALPEDVTHAAGIVHDAAKADRNGTRYMVADVTQVVAPAPAIIQTTGRRKRRIHRKGDRL